MDNKLGTGIFKIVPHCHICLGLLDSLVCLCESFLMMYRSGGVGELMAPCHLLTNSSLFGITVDPVLTEPPFLAGPTLLHLALARQFCRPLEPFDYRADCIVDMLTKETWRTDL